jgi:radical SAM superfamily enzyme YgiQ (UPF0313 family)
MKTAKKPSDVVNCLLVQPEFAAMTFWNFTESIRTTGAKAISPPLGLMTIASIFPQHWQFKLMDLNVGPFDEALWEWADIICTGGMLPQQPGIIEVLARAKKEGKYCAAGGPDPSSQPALYKDADVIVIGEAEGVIPKWLEAWESGVLEGVYESPEKPDVTQTPVPKYELIRFNDYYSINVQLSRGCPFNCEFCDIIELYGRKPRVKTVEQMLGEIEHLYNLGYRGWLDIVDDNFIGNKRFVKRHFLPALIEWNNAHGKPFYFSTECSMNLADDLKLMELMQNAGFRFVFVGIETPDPDVLIKTQKTQNTMKPIVDRINTIYEYGMMVSAGFIIGLDGEPEEGIDQAMIRCIEDTAVCMAMVGLLVALPNTQLTRRLTKEGRMVNLAAKSLDQSTDHKTGAFWNSDEAPVQFVDQTTAGLNFVTSRDRVKIFEEFLNVVKTVYEPKHYFDRVLDMVSRLKITERRKMSLNEGHRNLRALVVVCYKFTKDKTTRKLFWRNVFMTMRLGPEHFERAMKMMGSYLHFRKQVIYLEENIGKIQHLTSDSAHPLATKNKIQSQPSLGETAPAASQVAEINVS